MRKDWIECKFEDLLAYEQPTKYIVKSTAYNDDYKTPVLTAGKSFIKGYTNEEEGIFENLPTIIFDDFTTASQFVNFKFKVKSSAMKILMPTSKWVNMKFAYYYMQVNQERSDTHKRYWISVYAKKKILIPPFAEQRTIVAKIEQLFSELDNGIANLKTAKEQLKVYRQSVLKKGFESFKIFRPIGEIFESVVPNRDKPKSFSGHIKWITIPNLNLNSINLVYSKNNLGLTKQETQEFRAKIIPINSVIMTCVGSFGNSAIVNEEIVINQQLHAFLPNKDYDPKFVAYYIMYSKSYYNEQSTSTTISYLNKNRCNSLPFPIVDLEKQHQIVQQIESRLSVCDKVEETIIVNLQKAEALRHSILKKAFAGELLTEAEIAACKKEKDWEPAGELLKRIKKNK
jgi:type I restriction enzyme S subunit